MVKNYFKTAWRNLIKDKQFSFLNLLGLSTGLACVLLIFLWVNDELSVDKFNVNDNDLYQVMKTSPNADGTVTTYPSTQGLLGQSMQNELSEVQYATVVRAETSDEASGIISTSNKRFKASSEFVDQNFFKVFSYRIIDGNINGFASNKYGVLLSDKMALRLFKTTQNITGKTIEWSRGEFTGSYIVSGVFQSPPENATDQFDLIFNYQMLLQSKEAKYIADWGSNSEHTYLLLKKGTDVNAFNKKIKDFTKEKIKQFYPGDKGMLHWEGDIFVQKYSDRYLHGNYINGKISGGRIEYVKLFSIIAIFILVIACINFMNLSTAKASRRMKEVGIKKVVGASKGSLILQYIGESILMAFASLIIALLLVELLLPAFREITGKDISLHFNINLIGAAISIALITGLIAGSYPAFYLSGFKPVSILKGKLITSSGESWIRKGLVVFQFTISVGLIVSVLVVYQQMKLIQTTNLGYNKDNILTFSNDGDIKNNLTPFFTEIKKLPGVINVTSESGDFFGRANHSGSGIDWEGKDPNLGIEYYGTKVSANFFETMNLPIVDGREFRGDADTSSVIFNQSAIAAMGLKNPVGKMVSLWGHRKQIVGVVKDYHFKSLYEKVGPSFIEYQPNNETTLVKITAGNEKQTLAGIKNLFSKFNNGLEFNYSFLDDDYNKLYASEHRVAVLSKYFAVIAILISCLGLFGLAAFTAQKRQKEIGIRKVIGASVSSVVTMLSKDFLILVSISLLIAVPLSWWLMNNWLQSFAYRIKIMPWIFVIAGFSVIVITLLTISFQSIKAAIANPVKSLRTE